MWRHIDNADFFPATFVDLKLCIFNDLNAKFRNWISAKSTYTTSPREKSRNGISNLQEF